LLSNLENSLVTLPRNNNNNQSSLESYNPGGIFASGFTMNDINGTPSGPDTFRVT
jgi:hypothetical protein